MHVRIAGEWKHHDNTSVNRSGAKPVSHEHSTIEAREGEYASTSTPERTNNVMVDSNTQTKTRLKDGLPEPEETMNDASRTSTAFNQMVFAMAVFAQIVLAMAVFANNCVLDIGGPRLCKLYVASMVEVTSALRLNTCSKSKARISGELLEVKNGDCIEFWRMPPNKDTSGWHGPAKVTDTTEITLGLVTVRWQAGCLNVPVRDIRRAGGYSRLVCAVLMEQGASFTEPMEGDWWLFGNRPSTQRSRQSRRHGTYWFCTTEIWPRCFVTMAMHSRFES